jgi:hypothetical protein
MVPEGQCVVARGCHHRPMAIWIVVAAALMILAALALGLLAVVLRYRGRRMPRSAVRLGAAMFGGGAGVFLITFVRESFAWVAFAILAASFAYDLVRRGQRIAAGILLLTMGLPSALWWGQFVIRDLLDPEDLFLPVLWLWSAPGPILLIIGVVLVALGDRAARPVTLFETMPAHVRDPAALAHALTRGMQFAGVPIQVLVALTTAMLVIFILVPLGLGAGLPWPVVLVAGTATFALLGVELSSIVMPARIRRAWEGWSIIGDAELKRWRAAFGMPVPLGTAAVQRWLEGHPETPENRWALPELLVIAGRMEDARAVIQRFPESTAWQRFERANQSGFVDWVEGRDIDLDRHEAEAETVGEPESAERWLARAMVASARARDLAFRGGDWAEPLIDVRLRSGHLADNLLRNELRRRSYPTMLVVGVVFVGLVVASSTLLI